MLLLTMRFVSSGPMRPVRVLLVTASLLHSLLQLHYCEIIEAVQVRWFTEWKTKTKKILPIRETETER